MPKHVCIWLFLLSAWTLSSLAQTTNQTPRDQVLKHLQGIDTGNREMSVQSIRIMGSNAIPVLIEILGYRQEKLDEWHEQAYRNAPSSLQKNMSKPRTQGKLRHEVAQLLLMMPDTRFYLTAMLPLLQDDRAEVRREVARLLAGHAPSAEKGALLECVSALKDRDESVRRNIALAFSYGDADLPRVKRALEGALSDHSEAVRLMTAYALVQVDKNHAEALRTLRRLLKSNDTTTRYFAASYHMSSTLNSGVNPDLVEVFIGVLKEPDSGLHPMACNSLSRLGLEAKAAVPELLKHLQSTDSELQKAAREALEKIAPEVLPPVKP
jgi:hypothetical protein